MIRIEQSTFRMLKELKKNNNREWFNARKEKFVQANENFTAFVQTLIDKLSAFDKDLRDSQAKNAVFRIYRDTRFSNDKTPYKIHYGALLQGRGKRNSIAGNYLQVGPGNTFLAGGAHLPDPVKLKKIRQEISYNGAEFLKIINDRKFKSCFSLEGELLSRVPQGFDKGDPMSDYLKYKEMVMMHEVADEVALSPGFLNYCVNIFRAMMPLNQFFNRATSG